MKNASRVARYMMLRPENRQEENRRMQERGGEREQPRQQKRTEEYRSDERRPEGPNAEYRRYSDYGPGEPRQGYRREGYPQEKRRRYRQEAEDHWPEWEEPESRRMPRRSEQQGPGTTGRRMSYIGFGDREDDDGPPWRNSGHDGDEMSARKGERSRGSIRAEESEFTEKTADEWVRGMKNADGSTGPHWNMEQARQLAQRRGVKAAPAEFYAVLNAVYSDYCEVAKKHNVHNADFYADLAKAWLNDKDAVPDKAAAYFEYVVMQNSN